MKLKLLYFLPLLLFLIPVVGAGISFQPSVIEDIRILEGSDITLKNKPYIEYPTETWIIGKEDYFGEFLEWNFIPVKGQQGDKLLWNFTWSHRDYVIYNETGAMVDVIFNPIQELYDNKNNLNYLTVKKGELGKVEGFSQEKLLSLTDDIDKFINYPIEIIEKQKTVKNLSSYKIDITKPRGWFTIRLNKWELGIKLQIGLGSTVVYNNATNTITITGGTSGSPSGFWDIWNASNVEGWNISCQTCENSSKPIGTQDKQYFFNASIQIGDGSTSTYFVSEKEQVYVNREWKVKGEATFRIGKETVTGYGEYGSHITFDDTYLGARHATWTLVDGDGFLDVYDSYLRFHMSNWDPIQISGNFSIRNSIFERSDGDGDHFLRFWSDNVQVNRTTFMRWQSFSLVSSPVYFNENVFHDSTVRMYSAVHLFFVLSGSYNLKELKTVNVGRAGYIQGSRNCELNYIDCDLSSWVMKWKGTCTNTVVYRKYSINIVVKNETGYPLENVTVVLTDNNNNIDFNTSTDENGAISEQIGVRGHWNHTGTTIFYDHSPHHLQVTHSTGTADIYNITLGAPVDWEITIPEPSGGGGMALWLAALLLASIAFLGVKKK